MPFSTAHGNAVLDLFNAYDVSLHTGDPGGDGSANELVGGSYARQGTTTGAAANKTTSSTNTSTFTDLPAATITHAAFWDGVNPKWTAAFGTPIQVAGGESLQLGPGDITFTIT